MSRPRQSNEGAVAAATAYSQPPRSGTARAGLTPRPPLDGSTGVDVAIMGAGFTGLWTAYHFLQRDLSQEVLVVEREIAGFGPSGRNGGWCVADFPD